MRKFLFLVLIIVLGAAYWYQTKQKTPTAPDVAAKVPSKIWTLPFRPPTAAENAQARKIVVRVDKQIDGAALASVCVFHPSHGEINTGATSKESNMSVVESRIGKSEEDWEVTKQQIAIVSHPQAATLVPGRTVAFKGILGQPIAIPGGKTVPSASAFAIVAPGK
jgi:hypothetical protein